MWTEPKRCDGTCPVIQTTGVESVWASAIPVTRLVAPGPEVAITAPTLPEDLACPKAAWIAPAHVLQVHALTYLGIYRSSYTGIIALLDIPIQDLLPHLINNGLQLQHH